MATTEIIIEQLKSTYGNIEVTTLGKLAESIKQASSVRSGNNANDLIEYYEVGVSDIDRETNYVEITDKTKKYDKCNINYLNSQKLQEGDIILGYRGRNTDKIGIVTKKFGLPLVPNNGLIRIRFKGEQKNISPNIIWSLLLSPMYQDYLQSILHKDSEKNLLSVNTLKELPIPRFYDGIKIDKAIDCTVDINKKIKDIDDIWEDLKQKLPGSLVADIASMARNNNNNKRMHNETLEISEKISEMKNSIKELETKIKSFIDLSDI